MNDLPTWIRKSVGEFGTPLEKNLMNPQHEPAWDKPLVGFANGNDPLWNEYKGHIGDFYWTPQEIFGLTFPSLPVRFDELTSISWILPQTKQTRLNHGEKNRLPSERYTAYTAGLWT